MIDFTNLKIENQLWPEDEKLFEAMENSYTSERERVFFETMHVKMLTECAPCGEELLWDSENEDKIYFTRDGYDEFIVGSRKNGLKYEHFMNLSETLSANLKSLTDRNITMLQWLRKRDYKDIVYNHNNAYL